MISLPEAQFRKAAQFAASVVSRKNAIPVLTTIKVTANGALSVEGTDLDMHARATLDYEGDECEFLVHEPGSEIGRAVALTIHDAGWPRFAVRFSGAPHEEGASRVIGPGESDPDAVLCPAQTGATECCATCALCWNSRRSIAFRRH